MSDAPSRSEPASATVTVQPLRASSAAVARPIAPAPTTTARRLPPKLAPDRGPLVTSAPRAMGLSMARRATCRPGPRSLANDGARVAAAAQGPCPVLVDPVPVTRTHDAVHRADVLHRDAVVLARALDGHVPVDHVVEHELRVALERVAVAAASRRAEPHADVGGHVEHGLRLCALARGERELAGSALQPTRQA